MAENRGSNSFLGVVLGGFVAVEFAARYPSRVKSLVLVDGGVLTREADPGADRVGLGDDVVAEDARAAAVGAIVSTPRSIA